MTKFQLEVLFATALESIADDADIGGAVISVVDEAGETLYSDVCTTKPHLGVFLSLDTDTTIRKVSGIPPNKSIDTFRAIAILMKDLP